MVDDFFRPQKKFRPNVFYAATLFGSSLSGMRKNASLLRTCYYRERTKGSWTLTNGEKFWPIADTTAESLKAIILLSKINPDLVGDPIKEERLYDAVDCHLSYVNKDGTLSSAECKRTTSWVEFINPSESFRNIIVDYPYPECTSSLIQALILFRGIHPMYRHEEIEKIIKNGASFIEKKPTKGWVLEYVDNGSPHAVNTAMAMLALLYAGRVWLIYVSISVLFTPLKYHINIIVRFENYLHLYACASIPNVGSSKKIEHDPTPLYRAAKELINMHMETGEFPQQLVMQNLTNTLNALECADHNRSSHEAPVQNGLAGMQADLIKRIAKT
ncbi:hypothetical protein C2845_PM15G03490 [Panicum miliaceum]|uniref:Uncharacterized protein n=1 Tax=Panicum miliaceum TaxID=4540 RepID=A0A3L6Q9S1_PANMI|nr:hypothetical protein C2845_PM15G03490 [Panicum miliaceum]